MKIMKIGLFLTLFTIVPFLISLIISENDYLGFIQNEVTKSNDWIGFAGGYLGGAISGIITYIGVRLTIKNNKESVETQQRLNQRALLTAEVGSSPWYFNTKTSTISSSSNNFNPKKTKIIHNEALNLIIRKINRTFYIIRELSQEDYTHYQENNTLRFCLCYVIIKNPDQTNAINCKVLISINGQNIDEGIALIEPGEEFVIPINEVSNEEPFIINSIEITYITKLGEKMKLQIELDETNNTINTSYYAKEKSEYFPIFKDALVQQSTFSHVQKY